MNTLTLPEHPTLADFKRYVEQMEHERGFSDETILHSFMLLVEEVGELAKCIRKDDDIMRMDANKQHDDNATHEVSDVFSLLLSIANRLGVDIEQAFREKEAINSTRTWKL